MSEWIVVGSQNLPSLAEPAICITHAPGHMFITDVPEEEKEEGKADPTTQCGIENAHQASSQ